MWQSYLNARNAARGTRKREGGKEREREEKGERKRHSVAYEK